MLAAMLPKIIAEHRIASAVTTIVFFLVVTFPIWLAQVWTLFSARPFADVVEERGVSPLAVVPLYGWFCLGLGCVMVGLLIWIAVSGRTANEIAPPVIPDGVVQLFAHTHASTPAASMEAIRQACLAAGWEVRNSVTGLEIHTPGVWVHGGSREMRAKAFAMLNSLGVSAREDDRIEAVPLQIIIGARPIESPVRILERFYLALAHLRADIQRIKTLQELGGTPSATAYTTLGLAVGKIRKELVDLSPSIFTTSEALDFSQSVEHAGLSDEWVPKDVDLLMKSVLTHWGRRAEAAGITPLKFKDSPVVKL